MPYIGKTPLTGAYQLCDTITTSATATYNLLVGGSAVIPGAAQNCIVSLNGVVQAPVSAYTVSGSTITFSSTLSATDVIDFILILGNVFDIGKPTDGSVTNASVASNAAIALSKLATTGTMTFASTIGVGGATPAASGAGITFPASVSASSDANTLDDYEEGTFTPVIADASSGGNTGTFSDLGAYYIKIGKQVTLQVYLSAINTTGMTGANIFFIRNLPFTSSQTATGNFYTYRVGRDASTASSCVLMSSGATFMQFNFFTTNSATTDRNMLVSNIVSGTSEIILTITYTA
jgi:hypothetical protein